MLDEKDLQAIAGLINDVLDEKINASEARMKAHVEKAIDASEARMLARMETRAKEFETRMETKTQEFETRMETRTQEFEARMETRAKEFEARMETRAQESEARMETRAQEAEARMEARAQESEARMLSMMEAWFEPRFNLLGEQIQLIQEKLTPSGALEDLEDRVDVVEVVVKQHSREIETLKKAQ